MPEHKQHIHSQDDGENESEPRVQFAISRDGFCYHSHARHERNKDWDKLDEKIKEFQLHLLLSSHISGLFVIEPLQPSPFICPSILQNVGIA